MDCPRPAGLPDERLLGACYAVGEALGFNPLFLRLLFAFAILWSPALGLAAYAALTAIVALARWVALLPSSGEAPGSFSRRGYQGIAAPR